MKKRMRYVLLMVAVLLSMALVMGCGILKEKEPEAGGLLDNSGMQSGASVSFSRDEQGNKTYSYTNPDGTGGGGVEIK